jgi:transcription elongation factor Elf1
MAKKINNCIKCGSDDIKVHDCGYSSFNCGGAKCNNCGNEKKVNYNEGIDDVIDSWNKHSPTVEDYVQLLHKRVEGHKKSIEKTKEEITKYTRMLMEEKYKGNNS